jgi:hypothetical protein
MRSFLDKPKTKAQTIKGSGKIDYYIHAHNHSTSNICNIPGLTRAMNIYFIHNDDNPARFTYDKVTILHNRISVNGRWWDSGTECTYLSTARGADQPTTIEVGLIQDFLIVEYTHSRGRRGLPPGLAGTALFIRMEQYQPRPAAEDNMFLCPNNPGTVSTIVPVRALCAYLTNIPTRKRSRVHRNLMTVCKAFPES